MTDQNIDNPATGQFVEQVEGTAPARPEAIAAFLQAAGLDLDDEPIPTEALIRQVAGICRKLEDELGRGDYGNAQATLDRLVGIYPELKILIDLATDKSVRDPLIDVYEAAVELRIKANSALNIAEQREAYFRRYGVERLDEGRNDG